MLIADLGIERDAFGEIRARPIVLLEIACKAAEIVERVSGAAWVTEFAIEPQRFLDQFVGTPQVALLHDEFTEIDQHPRDRSSMADAPVHFVALDGWRVRWRTKPRSQVPVLTP